MNVKAFSDPQGRENFIQDFSTLPERTRQEKYRTGLLPGAIWQRFLQMPTPFAKEFWIVTNESGQCMGRIGANVSATYPDHGFLGFFEVDMNSTKSPACAKTLLATAEAWLANKGCKVALGPVNFNTWFPYRFRLSEDQYQFPWEPVHPPEYLSFFEAAAYKLNQSYHSEAYDLVPFLDKTKPDYEKTLSLGFHYRPFDAEHLLEKEVPILYRLSMESFRDNYLFEPTSLEAFRELYVPIAKKMDFGFSYFALSKDHHPAGFVFGFLESIGGEPHLAIKTLAVHPDFRGQGISNALTHVIASKAGKQGVRKIISAMVKSGAQSESYAKKSNVLWRHRYGLFQKTIR